ncbi:Capsule assembly protein Wzi [Marinobacter sp. LV10R510-11A]|uniref:capsule assembly Wzi family protein n=1 Tax=Marinobacter sp. LV10R510-11A TaxID=1415568 RepID=UPI000BB85457|nr:capsule assembly Wzi family protein [Marinobacter sp. LV10R510-11A]SOB74535.1 Capsule assembly protein Wzi [Marinobacter sp. LV10R510-11A]SOB78489.1 Capsule assembly protein Wzi [Marinobacter sp. LV10R510-11A]
MTLKHWTLVGGAVACLASFYTAAAPWLEPGDARARFAVQKLADRGHLSRPVTSWPIMWGSITNGLNESDSQPGSVTGLARNYLEFERSQQASPGFRAEFEVSATNEVAMVQGFDRGPMADAAAKLDVQWQGQNWAFGLSPAYAHNPDDNESARFDGSYLAATAGNWVFGAGAVDRWWGPGWQSSLILSNNARPMPSVWLNRKDASAPESRWLSWIGPWQFTLLAGQYEKERKVPEAKLIGMRLNVRPFDGLELGFSRAIMFGGEGRPEGGSTIWNALIGKDNGQLEGNDPGNQLASIDARYGFAIGNQSMGVYAQMMGEDEAGAFPARKSWLLGTDWTSQLFSGEQQWFIEYANTLADDFMGTAMPGITYDHSRYKSGYRYYGRTMGASFSGDAEAITLGGFHFFDDGRNLSASLSVVEFNKDGARRTPVIDEKIKLMVPAESSKQVIGKVAYGTQLLNGWLDLSVQFADKKLELVNLAENQSGQWSVGASWRYRF